MRILLVEPQYEHPFPHLFLLKAITFHRSQGNDVKWTRGYGIEYAGNAFDLIQITTPVFSWAVPNSIQLINWYTANFPNTKIEVGGTMGTVHSKIYEASTGIKPFQGVHSGIVNSRPAWEEFPKERLCRVQGSIGCNVGCGFCIVPRIYGTTTYEVWNWQSHFNERAEVNHLIDDNFSLSVATIKGYADHLLEFFANWKAEKKTFDLNSGVEPQSFTDRTADIICQLPIKPIRTALDETREAEKTLRAIEILHQRGFNANQIHVYLLYGFVKDGKPMDTIEDALYRLSLLVPEGKDPIATPFAMRFVPLDWFGDRFGYQPPQYSREDYIQFARYVNMMKRRDFHSKHKMSYQQFKEWAKSPATKATSSDGAKAKRVSQFTKDI